MKIIYNSPSKYIMLIIIVLGGKMLQAQQQPQYTQYMYNTTVINPAYSGTNGRLEASLLHRSQWGGIEGAPTTQSLAINGKVGERVGLGLNAMNDKVGPSNEVAVNGVFSYHLITGQNTRLSLGINVGFDVINIDWSKGRYYDNQDVVFNENINEVRPLFGAGAFYYGEKWYVGVSAPNLLQNNSYDPQEEVMFQRMIHYYFTGGYVFDLSHQLKFKPAILATVVRGAPISFDISANFLIIEKFTLGAAYRINDAFSALFGIQLGRNFFVGYAYDHSVTDIRKYNDGSHEIILKYFLPTINEKVRSPRFF